MIPVGTPLPEWRLTSVSPEKMKVMAAILRDPNPIHWDRRAVLQKGFGTRLINQGPINVGYVMNMLMAWAGNDAIRSITVRFTANVLEGDEVVAGGKVTAVEGNLVTCHVWLERGDGERALVGTAKVEIGRR
ncbi:MAG: hypothetical protein KatS3mg011_2266 [Acidimicrobiia bacterium]|nr:MAG: hypothetical protein KatS3mg011_2266 [Acidimicrobiia bacterium]